MKQEGGPGKPKQPLEETPSKEWEKFAKRQENAKKNAEKFGYTVSINTGTSPAPALEGTKKAVAPGTSLTEPVVIDALTRRVRQDRKKEAANRAQQDKGAHVDEAEGLLKELARRSNQETLKKQVDEDLKIAAGPEAKPGEDREAWRKHFGPLADIQEGKEAAEKKEKDLEEWRKHFGILAEIEEGSAHEAPALHEAPPEKKMFTPTPEQQRGLDRLKANIAAAAAAQEAANKQKAEKLGFWGTIKKVGDNFKELPLLAAVKITEGLRSLAKQPRKHPFLAAAAVAGILYAIYRRSGALAEVDTTPLDAVPTMPVTTEVLPPVGIFDGRMLAENGDSVWGLIENGLSQHTAFNNLGVEEQTYIVDKLKDSLQTLDQDTLRQMGIMSGDIDLVHPGENIDLSYLNKFQLDSLVDEARNLTREQIASIKYNLAHNIR